MRIAIIGAGGFAREIAWLVRDIAEHQALNKTTDPMNVAGFLVSDLSKVGERDEKALGDFSWLERNHVDGLAMGIGSPEIRCRLSAELKNRFPQLRWPALIHPSVKYDSSCRFAEGVTVSAGTIATVNVSLDAFSMVNLSCTLGHESRIGAWSVVNPLTAISGGVKVGQRVLVGTHASVLQYVSVGNDAIIGSGAMVGKDVEPGTTVVGVPAKPREKAASASA